MPLHLSLHETYLVHKCHLRDPLCARDSARRHHAYQNPAQCFRACPMCREGMQELVGVLRGSITDLHQGLVPLKAFGPHKWPDCWKLRIHSFMSKVECENGVRELR